MRNFALASVGAFVVYCVYRLWEHDRKLKRYGIATLLEDDKPRDEFSGVVEEVERFYNDGTA